MAKQTLFSHLGLRLKHLILIDWHFKLGWFANFAANSLLIAVSGPQQPQPRTISAQSRSALHASAAAGRSLSPLAAGAAKKKMANKNRMLSSFISHKPVNC